MVKTRTWIVIIALIFTVSAVLCIWLSGRKAAGTIANIYQDGVCIESIDLSLVTEGYEFTVTGENGENTIRVERGRIGVISADCPDKVCVKDGWLSDSASPIVCLPHRLVICLEQSAAADQTDLQIDAVSQ